jgi:hypothetical protein
VAIASGTIRRDRPVAEEHPHACGEPPASGGGVAAGRPVRPGAQPYHRRGDGIRNCVDRQGDVRAAQERHDHAARRESGKLGGEVGDVDDAHPDCEPVAGQDRGDGSDQENAELRHTEHVTEAGTLWHRWLVH